MNQAEKKNKKTKGKKYKKELILPLYFGWELVLRKVSDLKKHIVGPFKEYWQYLTAVLILIVIVSTALILKNNNPTLAATYGWVQSTWSGGASTTAVATHTSNQDNWTQYYSADDNISTSSDQLTLSSGSTSVEDTATADFDAGSDSGNNLFILDTSGDQLTGKSGYDATGICGDFIVFSNDRSTPTTRSNAINYCDGLCPTCDLPNATELQCICNNKASFGDNFVANKYWSIYMSGGYGRSINFSTCGSSTETNKNFSYYVRCIRR